MSEQDVRDGLRAAVLAEPALSFDPDLLMARARQETRRRRALAGAGTATVLVAVTAVAVPTVLGAPRGSGSGVSVGSVPSAKPSTKAEASTGPRSEVATRTTTAAADAFPWPPAGSPVDYTGVQLKARGDEMRQYLRTTFGHVVPGAKLVNVQAFGGEASGVAEDGQNYLNTFIAFTLNGTSSAVSVATFAPGAGGPQPLAECGESCKTRVLPDGSHLVTGRIEAGAGNWLLSVWHFRTTGAVVQLAGYNYDPVNGGSVRKDVPVTLDQLTALATDPKIGL